MSSDPAVAVSHVSKDYLLGLTGRSESLLKIFERRLRHPIHGRGRVRERFRALDDVSFEIAPGEAVGFIGRNGAGKSTLLKILSRITPPSEGTIELAGSVGSLLEVGTGFHPELTGLENVYLNGMILGMSKRDVTSRLDEIVDFAEVHRFLDTPVKRYSSGMRVRLAFAVAAHLEPEILIIDEVLSVGDFAFQRKCLEKMRTVASDDGRTVLFVSHNLVTVEHLCPRACLLVDGRLVFDGTTEETLSRYLSEVPEQLRAQSDGVFDLSDAEHTGSQGHQVFKRLEIRPNGGPCGATVRMGERLQIEIGVEGLDEIPNASVVVVVGSPDTECLFRMTGRMRPLESAGERASEERIVIDIPAVVLTPGEYHLNVALYEIKDTVLLHEVRHAASFTVIPADVLGTGYIYSSNDGPFAVPWDWEVRPAVPDAITGGQPAARS